MRVKRSGRALQSPPPPRSSPVGAGWLAVVAAAIGTPAALLVPSTVLADAIPPAGGPEPVEPSVVETLVGFIQPVAFLGLAMAAVYVGARLIARIGPRSPAPGAVATERRGRVLILLVAAIAVVPGVALGRAMAYQASIGGMAVLGAAVLAFATAVVAGGLAGMALLALWMRRGHPSTAIRAMLLSAGLLVAGAVGGNATAGLTGGLYRPPVVLGAAAEVQLSLAPTQPASKPRAGGQGACRSVADSQRVEAVDALDLGAFGTATLRGTIVLAWTEAMSPHLELWIDAGDLPEGAIAPSWSGPAPLQLIAPLGTAGTATFDATATAVSSKAGREPADSAPGDWPARLAGQIQWTCAEWVTEAAR